MKFEKAPPTDVCPAWSIIVCKAGTPLSFVSLSNQYTGLYTHWFGGHTVACFQPKGCKACDAASRREFKAYIPGMPLGSHNRFLFQLTHTSTLALHPFLWREEGILGLKIKLERAGKKDTSMLEISTYGFEPVADEVKAVTVERMLGRIFAKNAGGIFTEPETAA